MKTQTELFHLELSDLQAAIRQPGPNLPAGMSLRAADPEADLTAIAGLYNAAFEREPADQVTADRIAAYAQHPGLGAPGVVLALHGDLAVGLAVAKLEVPVRGRDARQGSLELLAVHPAYQGQGLGQALAHRALSWLAGQGATTVSATTDHPAALAILRQLGFQLAEGQARAAEYEAAEA